MTSWEWRWVGIGQRGSLGEAPEADAATLMHLCTAFTMHGHYNQDKAGSREETWVTRRSES